MPIEHVLRLLVRARRSAWRSIRTATGSFRGELKQLTLREALTTLLAPLGLDFTVQGTVIRVTPHQPETRQFDLNLLTVQRAMQRDDRRPATAPRSPRPRATDEVFAGMAEGVTRAAVGDRPRARGRSRRPGAGDRLSRSGWTRVALYIETLQQRSGRQVRLQSQVFEVTLKDARVDRLARRPRDGSGCRPTPRPRASAPIRRRSAPRSRRRERSAISGRPT